MSLDPASVQALLASLKLRTDDLAFEVVQTPNTAYRLARSRNVDPNLALLLAPAQGAPGVLYSFACAYRLQRLRGYLVSTAGNLWPATGVLAQVAEFEMDAIDARYPQPQTPAKIPWVAPYGNEVTAQPSAIHDSLLLAASFGWRVPGT